MSGSISQESETISQGTRPVSVMLAMVCFYVFLVIERPWESIRYLEGIPLERLYALLLIAAAFAHGKFQIISSPTNKWVYGLLTLHFVLAPFAFNSGYAVDQAIEYGKMVVLYLLMLSVAEDEESLKVLIKAYVFSTMLYVAHSFWEYNNGRHFYRMGISRMIGVDDTFSDPNTFGATIVLSLPFVYALLRSELKKNIRLVYYIYFTLAVTCVVLSGSRSSLVALLVLCGVWVMTQKGNRKFLIFIVALLSMTLVWNIMPGEKQERFRTLWDDEAGPKNAKESAEGRLAGWKASWRMFKQEPLTGVGAGVNNYIGYRLNNKVDDGPPIPSQSHVLYGEVLAEFGIVGAAMFIGLIVSIYSCCRSARVKLLGENSNSQFLSNLGGAILVALLLLLVFGFGGHNFYRPLWLWLAAWSGTLYTLGLKKTEKQMC